MLLNESITGKPIFEEKDASKLPEAVLCRVSYPVCNINERNANKRVYERSVWDKVLGDEVLQEMMAQRRLFGHAEHPAETQSDLQLTSHVIHNMWIDESSNKVYQTIDVLDVPMGRIVDSLLRAGCMVGMSTRAEGDLEESEDDQGKFSRVLPESYRYITTDFTADPSTFGALPMDLKRGVVSTIATEMKNESAEEGERSAARVLFESILEPVKYTIASLIKEGRLRENNAVVRGSDKGVLTIKEGNVQITVDGRTTDLNGVEVASVYPDGAIHLWPAEDSMEDPFIVAPEGEEVEGGLGFGEPAPEELMPEEEMMPEEDMSMELPSEEEVPMGEPEMEVPPMESKVHEDKMGQQLIKSYKKYEKDLAAEKDEEKRAKLKKSMDKVEKQLTKRKLDIPESKVNESTPPEDAELVALIQDAKSKAMGDPIRQTAEILHALALEYQMTLGDIDHFIPKLKATMGQMQDVSKYESKVNEDNLDQMVAKIDELKAKIDAGKGSPELLAQLKELEKEVSDAGGEVPESKVEKATESIAESYGTGDVKSDIEKGVDKKKIIKKIRDRYIDMDVKQANQIYTAVKSGKGKPDWSHAVESVTSIAKELTALKIKEATERAEREVAVEAYQELLEKLNISQLKVKMIMKRATSEQMKHVSSLVFEAEKTDNKTYEVDALRSKLEEKAKAAFDAKESLQKIQESVDKTSTALNEAVNERTKQVESLQEAHKKVVEKTRKVGIKEGAAKVVEEYVAYKLTELGMSIGENTRALLDECTTLREVDNILEKVTDIMRRSALHSNSIVEKIHTKTPPVDPEQSKIDKDVYSAMEGM